MGFYDVNNENRFHGRECNRCPYFHLNDFHKFKPDETVRNYVSAFWLKIEDQGVYLTACYLPRHYMNKMLIRKSINVLTNWDENNGANNIKYDFTRLPPANNEPLPLAGSSFIYDDNFHWVFFNVPLTNFDNSTDRYFSFIESQSWCIFRKLIYVNVAKGEYYSPAVNNVMKLT